MGDQDKLGPQQQLIMMHDVGETPAIILPPRAGGWVAQVQAGDWSALTDRLRFAGEKPSAAVWTPSASVHLPGDVERVRLHGLGRGRMWCLWRFRRGRSRWVRLPMKAGGMMPKDRNTRSTCRPFRWPGRKPPMHSFVFFGQSTRGRMTSRLRTSPGMRPAPSASVMAGAYPRRRNGNMPPGPGRRPVGRSAMTSASLESTPGIVPMLRTSPNPLAVSRPIPGGSLTCMAMSGSGCRIAGMTTMTKHHPVTAFRWSRGIGLLVFVIRTIPLPAPLPDIAVHVKESPRIRRLAACRLSGILTVGVVPGIAIQRAVVVSAEKAALCPSAAGIFPFRLGGETVALGTWLPLHVVPVDPVTGGTTLVLRQPVTKLYSIKPTHRSHRRSSVSGMGASGCMISWYRRRVTGTRIISKADTRTACTGPSFSNRPASSAGLPMWNTPPGMRTISRPGTLGAGVDLHQPGHRLTAPRQPRSTAQ